MATTEGTARLLARAVERGALHPRNLRQLPLASRPPVPTLAAAAAAASATPPSPRLFVASVGFGAYRIGGGEQEHAHLAALRSALRSGVNLVDTSSHYYAASGDPGGGHGASERLVGRAVAEAVREGDVTREGLVLTTKVGHARMGAPAPPGAVPIGPPAGHGGSGQEVWHSIHPEFVDMEVRMCRERLGTAPDFVLLHNPEYFLSAQLQQRVPIADAWDEMYDRLRQAFGALEALCDEGVIRSGYGVSSNFLSCMFSTTGRPNLYEALAMDRVMDAAAAAASGKAGGHRLLLAQLPLNAVEGGGVLGRGAALPEAAEGDCELAARLGLGLLANRPLNALPLPGVSTGDWGRSGATHLQLRDKKPMGAVESLLKRVISEALAEAGAPEAEAQASLQRLALKLSLSAPGVSASLCGMRTEGYVEDAAAVLREEPFTEDQVRAALAKVRAAAEELGCEKRGLW